MINDRPRLHGEDRDFEERGLVIDFTAVETKRLRRKVPACFGILAKRVGEEKRYLYIVIIVVVVRWLNDSRDRVDQPNRAHKSWLNRARLVNITRKERKSCPTRGEDRYEKKSKNNEVKAVKKSMCTEKIWMEQNVIQRKWILK